MNKGKLLFVIPWLPYPMLSGGHQALYNGIAAIANDYEVSLTYGVADLRSYLPAEKAFQERFPNMKLYPLICEESQSGFSLFLLAKKCVKKILSFFKAGKSENGVTGVVEYWKTSVTPANPRWVRHLVNLCASNDFDLIQVEMPWMISDVFALPVDVKKIFVHHELGFVCRKLQLANIVDEVEYAAAVKKYADMNEIGQLNLYDGIITLSPIDEQKLKEAGVSKPVFKSFAVIDSIGECSHEYGDGKRLTFIGPDSHAPNLSGITWFLENCWSDLKSKCPDITLDVIGKWSDKNISYFKSNYADVNFLGFVDDLSAVVQGSTMIVPIMVGSGIRMKILEAASKSVPFVSTSVGAEGIPVVSGNDCFIADDPFEFVSAIVNLQDKDIRKKFADNAYDMVRNHYSLDALRKNRIEIYNNFLS